MTETNATTPHAIDPLGAMSRIFEAKRTPRSAESRELLQWLSPYPPEAFKLATPPKRIDALFRRTR